MPAPTRTLITDALRRSREAHRAGALALDLPAPAEAARAIRRARVLAGYDALMIGDSSEADGGATRIGSAFELVHDVPPQQRPTALVDAVERHGIALS